MFPDRFDDEAFLDEGCAGCDFFYPADVKRLEHLVQLSKMLCDERVVAAAAYADLMGVKACPDELNENVESERRLEAGYLHFKLADSLESARFLIAGIKELGAKQAADGSYRRQLLPDSKTSCEVRETANVLRWK